MGYEITPKLIKKMKLEYETAGRSLEFLIDKYDLDPDAFRGFVKTQNWQQETIDPHDPKAVNQFYSEARKRLSVEVVQRAISLFLDIADIEDAVLKDLQEKFEKAEQGIGMSVSDLNKIMKMIDALKNSTKIYNEAFEVPAIADRDIKSLLDTMEPRTLADIEKYIKENGIPIPDIEIDDLPQDSL